MNVHLSQRAAFLHIHLTDRKTGVKIPGMYVTLMSTGRPAIQLISMSCPSDRPFLIPPNKTVLLHVRSDGYSEWKKTNGKGKRIHMRSGSRRTLEVQLEPLTKAGPAQSLSR
jgi:hypothetical protein